MDLYEALFTRRSIRAYTDEPVSEADLEIMLKAAMAAPSARNEQPWRFVVVRDAETREKLSRTSPYTHMAARAPVVIIVCADMRDDKAEGMWVQDCAAATQNLMLAARGKSIGTVWCGVYSNEERMANVRSALGMPQEIVPFGLLCLGHTEQPFAEVDRFRPEYVHYEKW